MKRRTYYLFLISFLAVILIFTGCQTHLRQANLAGTNTGRIRNVIIMIGDGMGPQAVGLLNSYAKYAPNSIYKAKGKTTALEKVMEAGTLGYVYHEAVNVLVTDSAASATQMASGKRALSETIGIDQYGYPTETILEKAEKIGKSTGLVSDTRITHATPAGFAAHQPHRSKEDEIAVDLMNNKVDVMLSGGLYYWIPKEANDPDSDIHKELKIRTGGNITIKSKRTNGRNLLDEAENSGYALVFTKAQLEQEKGNKLLGLFSNSYMPYRIDLDLNDPTRTIPSLKEMTMKALEILSKNENGFFLMVESGLIDQAAHENDAGTMLHEMIRFDETLSYIFEWVKDRNDTLLIITADHATGGFGFSYTKRNIPEAKDFPGPVFKGVKLKPTYNYGSYDILDRIYEQKVSYGRMMKEFDALPDPDQTSAAMAEIINRNTEFPITEADASAILETEENAYYDPDHSQLKVKIISKIDDFEEFYIDSTRMRQNILGRVAAKYQNVVWSTGGHLNTPVPLIVFGPGKVTETFNGMHHTTEWAQYAIEALSSK